MTASPGKCSTEKWTLGTEQGNTRTFQGNNGVMPSASQTWKATATDSAWHVRTAHACHERKSTRLRREEVRHPEGEERLDGKQPSIHQTLTSLCVDSAADVEHHGSAC